MKTEREERPRSPHLGSCPGEESIEEFDVLISTEGTVTFSWNTRDIQNLARLLGTPEFDPPTWCG
jgi:hypothetical protein